MFYPSENKRLQIDQNHKNYLIPVSIILSGKVFSCEVIEIYFAFFNVSITDALKML
jgi:hypothetical protein